MPKTKLNLDKLISRTKIYLVVIAIAVILFIYSAILILKSQERAVAAKVSKNLKIGMLITFVAFVFGSLM